MVTQQFDLVIIGSGPAGHSAALTAAELGKSVAIVDGQSRLASGAIPGGTVPSKTLREAILYLSGFKHRPFFGHVFEEQVDPMYVRSRVGKVVKQTATVNRAQLRRKGVTLVEGVARFTDAHTVEVILDSQKTMLQGEFILIACGARERLDPDLPFDGHRILGWHQLQSLSYFPRDVIIVGAGVIGMEYATMLATLGTQVTIIERKNAVLDWLDHDIRDALIQHMQHMGTVFHLGTTVESVEKPANRVVAKLANGKTARGAVLVYAAGRQGNADRLNLQAASLQADEQGRLSVNERLQTRVQHIYAAGDVIGFPALASTSLIQGRLAALRMWGVKRHGKKGNIPYGIYTVPEISTVGRTEQELRESKTPYVVGMARYEELVKGQILGNPLGMLKLLFDPESHKLLGVHALGESAAELIHVGQAVLAHGGPVEYFRDNVFNHPTFTEAYRLAALDGLSKQLAQPV